MVVKPKHKCNFNVDFNVNFNILLSKCIVQTLVKIKKTLTVYVNSTLHKRSSDSCCNMCVKSGVCPKCSWSALKMKY